MQRRQGRADFHIFKVHLPFCHNFTTHVEDAEAHSSPQNRRSLFNQHHLALLVGVGGFAYDKDQWSAAALLLVDISDLTTPSDRIAGTDRGKELDLCASIH